jgi:putative transcriptional regulator
MLGENIKNLRKEKGISQQDLAVQLNVVRQTISKWEQGLSVPDAEMLLRIADFFGVSSAKLLGETMTPSSQASDIAESLAKINIQLAERNRRSRRIWKTIGLVLLGLLILSLLLIILSLPASQSFTVESTSIEEIGSRLR